MKIYPVAITISLPLVFLVFYIINQGHFEVQTCSSINPELVKKNNILFIGCDVKWMGFGQPKIHQVNLINEDNGTNNNEIDITPFIENQPLTELAVFTEEEASRSGLNERLVAVRDYKVNNSFRLIIKIEYEDEKVFESFKTLSIRYNTFGIIREQQIRL